MLRPESIFTDKAENTSWMTDVVFNLSVEAICDFRSFRTTGYLTIPDRVYRTAPAVLPCALYTLAKLVEPPPLRLPSADA